MAPVASVLLLASCNDSNPMQPPPVIPNPPKISCPAPVTVKTNGPLPSVVYGSATSSFGSPPVNVVCSPASGSVFPIGTSNVTCTATDQLQRTDTCSFTVTVTVPPQISLTSFAAYGDSMTAGEVVSEGVFSLNPRSRPFRVDTTVAYPTDLLAELSALYSAQSIHVTNLGESGATTGKLKDDFPILVPTGVYQVLLLMAGANDLPAAEDGDTTAIPTAVDNMRQIITQARNKGLRVFVATLPPAVMGESCFGETNGGAADQVVPFNNALKTMLASQNAVLVDVYPLFVGKTSTLIDCDGLHPTKEGYQVIADTFFASIKQTLQVPSTPLRTLAQPSFAPVPVRRR
jgi:lysophospholipase L1-like esterase